MFITRGIQAALPHIDDFLPVHNLASLEDLANRLSELDRRPDGVLISTKKRNTKDTRYTKG
jgi:uncharacterized protein